MRRWSAAVAAALCLSCGQVFYVELVIPELRVSLPAESFPATGGPDTLGHDFEYDFGDSVPLVGDDKVTVDLRLTEISIEPAAGATDLGGVRSITLTVVNPDDPNDVVVAASYERPLPGPVSAIAVSGNANIDLGRFLSGSTFTAHAEMVYDEATPAFTANLAGRFSLVLRLEYGDYVF
jgi:hypothetical protein